MSTSTIEREPSALALVEAPSEHDAMAVFAAKDTARADRIIDIVRAKVREFEAMRPDVSTAAGRDLIRSFAHRVTKSKTLIEEAGKALADEQKEIPKRIDATRRYFKDELEAIRVAVRKPLTDWEEAEETRVNKIKASLAELTATIEDPNWMTRSSEQLRDRLGEIERDFGVISEDVYAEYTGAARELAVNAIASLETRIAGAEKREAEAAELAKLRAEAAERERKDREAKIAEEAAAKAKADADAARIAAEQRAADAVRAKEEAEQRAVEAAARAKADAEREIIERQAREAEEQRAREQDLAHKKRVNGEALADLIAAGIDMEAAKAAITAIARGQVRNIRIQY